MYVFTTFATQTNPQQLLNKHTDFSDFLLKTTHADAFEEAEIIQSLWSGYGRISRYRLSGSTTASVVVKFISLNAVKSHPRGWHTNRSHIRKIKSYEIETEWYKHWAQNCNVNCYVPKFLGSYSSGQDQWIVLEDLDDKFPAHKGRLTPPEVKVCLRWLAHFHAVFLALKPEGLWEIGTYWHLDTRPDELEKIEHQELKANAHLIDALLNNCKYQTIVHGDAKLANFCFSADGEKVAAVDFQYVGGGCGMKDVAYFLGSCLSSAECESFEKELLDYYFEELNTACSAAGHNFTTKNLEEEWRKMYPIACADFMRFMLGWMPSHQKIDRYNLRMVESVLGSL